MTSTSDKPSSRPSQTQLEALLHGHQQWLESAGAVGQQACLPALDLSAADLSASDLSRSDFTDCRLENTQLHYCRLAFTDLSASRGLRAPQLAGCDLTGAKLPSSIDFSERLQHTSALVLACRKVFFVMLLMVGYTWLTIATTTDSALLTNTATSPLPIILTKLPVSGFYWAAPLILFGLYLYLHLHLQRLWEDLAALPAIFADGQSLETMVSPWLLTGLLNAYNPHLRQARPRLAQLQNAIAVGLAWWAIPLTLSALWLRYLPRHDGVGSGLHLLCLALAASFGLGCYQLAVTTLSGRKPHRIGHMSRWLLAAVIVVLCWLILPLLSYGIIAPPSATASAGLDPRNWSPAVLRLLGYQAHADFSQQDVSSKPALWNDSTPMLDAVKGASLHSARLHRLTAVGAFLAKADLRQANLYQANLELADLRAARLQDSQLNDASLLQADLRGAVLAGANLRNAALLLAKLDKADLSKTDLHGAYLNRASLRDADLRDADLRGAYLSEADLRGADFSRALLREADFSGADLRQAKGLDCTQLQISIVSTSTRLPEDLLCPNLQ